MITLQNPVEVKLPSKTLTFTELETVFHDDEKNQVISATIKYIPGFVVLWRNEDYLAIKDWTKTDAKKKLLEILGDDISGSLKKMFPKALEDHPYGPGTILSQMLSTIGITASPTCKCKQNAILMNEKGNDWCEQNINTILEWMKEESIKRGLPFMSSAAKIMVNRAISKSKKLLEDASTVQA
jgi:hypothetical protein